MGLGAATLVVKPKYYFDYGKNLYKFNPDYDLAEYHELVYSGGTPYAIFIMHMLEEYNKQMKEKYLKFVRINLIS